MNGTVTAITLTSCYSSLELAEKVRDKLMEINENSPLKCWYNIKEELLCCCEDDVPCLKK